MSEASQVFGQDIIFHVLRTRKGIQVWVPDYEYAAAGRKSSLLFPHPLPPHKNKIAELANKCHSVNSPLNLRRSNWSPQINQSMANTFPAYRIGGSISELGI